MSDALFTAGIIGSLLGLGIAALAIVGMIVGVRDPIQRVRASGFVFVGFSVVGTSGAVAVLSRLGDRLPLVAGLPVIAICLAMALVLRLAASREFRRYRSDKS